MLDHAGVDAADAKHSRRLHYRPNHCGAFVLDPDGINVEAACHRPEGAAVQSGAFPVWPDCG